MPNRKLDLRSTRLWASLSVAAWVVAVIWLGHPVMLSAGDAERTPGAESKPPAEPRQDPRAEHGAVLSARRGEPFDDPATSPALARALSEAKARPGPEGEVFALVKVTDRATGERRLFTRGTPDPKLAEYLIDPDTAPAGKMYAETEGFLAEGGFEIVERSILVHDVPPIEKGMSRAELKELKLRKRNSGSGLHHRIEAGLRRFLQAEQIDPERTSSDRTITVAIELKDVPRLKLPKASDPAHAGLLWIGLDIAAQRERTLIQRKQDMRLRQGPLLQAIEESGGRVHYASWNSGTIQAEIPLTAIRSLARHPDLFSITTVASPIEDGYQGDDIGRGTNLFDFPFHAGFSGVESKHPSTHRILLGISEACVDRNHPAWRTGGASMTSRGTFYDCDPEPDCTLGGLENCWTPGMFDHGTAVLSVMTANFRSEQDPAILDEELQVRLSGTCLECDFVFMQDESMQANPPDRPKNDRIKVHDLACEIGVDIFQSSQSFDELPRCDAKGFLSSSVEALIDCDAVYVQSASNIGEPDCDIPQLDTAPVGNCTVRHPADHPWTLTVGGVKTDGPCDLASEWETSLCVHEPCASRGLSIARSIVDIAAPFRVNNGLVPGSPTQWGGFVGTSASSPITAGIVAILMDWYHTHIGNSIFYGNRMRNFMLLFGDRSADKDGVSQRTYAFDRRWGAGRIFLIPEGLPNWSLRRTSVVLGANQSHSFDHAFSPAVKFYKAVVWHDAPDYETSPLISLKLEPLNCNSSPGTQSSSFQDNKAMLVVPNLDGCTAMRFTIKNVPFGFSVTETFHYAAYALPEDNERKF